MTNAPQLTWKSVTVVEYDNYGNVDLLGIDTNGSLWLGVMEPTNETVSWTKLKQELAPK